MRTFLLYLAAGISYTLLGIYNQNYIYSVFEGVAYLLLFVLGIPALWRRLRQ